MKKVIQFIIAQLVRPECVLAIILFVMLLIDRLVSYDNIMAVNLNGWIGLFVGVMPWVALACVPVLAFGKWSRFIYYPVILLMLILETITVFTRINFHMQLDGDIVGILLNSSPSEMKWFVGHYFTLSSTFAALLIMIVTIFLIMAVHRLKKFTWTRHKAMCSAALLLSFCLTTPVCKDMKAAFNRLTSIFLITDSIDQWARYSQLSEMQKHPTLPNGLSAADNEAHPCLGVFVLGESATRNRWSLYGYSRKTTPCMDAIRDELFIYSDLVAAAPNTARSMYFLFTPATIERPSGCRYTFAQALDSVGIESVLYSNHSRWGRWDGVESFVFAGCRSMLFMGEQNLQSPWYDDVLLQYMDSMLAADVKSRVVFLHLMGSHVPQSRQYPHTNMPFVTGEFAHLSSGEKLQPAYCQEHYDNSIHFTDKILNGIVDRLRRRGGLSWMIYLSDHGETPNSKGWRVATDLDLWEIPMIMWMSEEYRKRYPDVVNALKAAQGKPLQSDMLLAGFLHIAGVRGGDVESEADFLDEKFKCRMPRIISDKVQYPPDASPK